jgi:hypothetical protein
LDAPQLAAVDEFFEFGKWPKDTNADHGNAALLVRQRNERLAFFC